MASDKHRKARYIDDKLALKLILLVFLLTAVVFLWSSLARKSGDRTHDTWVDANGHLHVLGLTLGETTLREAETILRSRSDVALYIYPREHPRAGMTLEAFFPSIADHTKVILLLEADAALLKSIEKHATPPHLYPNKVARMNLSPADIELAQALPVRELTLIPSIRLTQKDILNRFGRNPVTKLSANGEKILVYPELGLRVTLGEGDDARLHFRNPETQANDHPM